LWTSKVDEAELAELVHEHAHAGPRGPDISASVALDGKRKSIIAWKLEQLTEFL
jgi:hypothetical protein